VSNRNLPPSDPPGLPIGGLPILDDARSMRRTIGKLGKSIHLSGAEKDEAVEIIFQKKSFTFNKKGLETFLCAES